MRTRFFILSLSRRTPSVYATHLSINGWNIVVAGKKDISRRSIIIILFVGKTFMQISKITETTILFQWKCWMLLIHTKKTNQLTDITVVGYYRKVTLSKSSKIKNELEDNLISPFLCRLNWEKLINLVCSWDLLLSNILFGREA